MNDLEFMQRLLTIERRVDHLERLEPETGSGSGVVDGSGAADQVAYWVDSDTIGGDTGLTYTPGTNTVGIDNAQFDLTPTPTGPAEGLLYWNTDDGTLNLGMPGGSVNLQLGQEMLMRVKNETGAPVTNGQLVYISGGTGNRALISLAKADADATSHTTIGMATESIADTHQGYITTTGYVRDVNTLAYAPGTMLYLSATTAGAYTSTRPIAPLHGVEIGVVIRQHATEGIIYVTIDRGLELSALHDVLISGLANLNVLQYDSAALVWKNRTLAAAGIVGGSGIAGQIAVWDGTNSISGSVDLTSNTTNFLARGGGAASYVVEFKNSGFGTAFRVYSWNDTAGTKPSLAFYRGRGTETVPAYPNSGDQLGELTFGGSTGAINTVYATSDLGLYTTENHSATARGVFAQFRTILTGATALTARWTISGAGYWGYGTASPAVLSDWRENTAVTNAVQNLLDLSHTTTGTAADGFGLGMRHYLEDAGGTRRQVFTLASAWSTAAAGTRKDFTVLNPWDTAERDGLRLFADGARALVGIGLSVNPTARLQLPAGSATANTAPLKFTSGALLTAPEAGAMEYLTDRLHYTQTTGARRVTVTYNEDFTQSFLLMGA